MISFGKLFKNQNIIAYVFLYSSCYETPVISPGVTVINRSRIVFITSVIDVYLKLILLYWVLLNCVLGVE